MDLEVPGSSQQRPPLLRSEGGSEDSVECEHWVIVGQHERSRRGGRRPLSRIACASPIDQRISLREAETRGIERDEVASHAVERPQRFRRPRESPAVLIALAAH